MKAIKYIHILRKCMHGLVDIYLSIQLQNSFFNFSLKMHSFLFLFFQVEKLLLFKIRFKN